MSRAEEELFGSIGNEFLHFLETTEMQKSYKMPVLLAFYNDGEIRNAVTEDEILYAWKRFYGEGMMHS